MKTFFTSAFCLICTLFWLTNCQQTATDKTATDKTATGGDAASAEGAQFTSEALVRGEYLVNVLGCDDCHTPKTMTPQGPIPDMSRRFIGHPATEVFVLDDEKKSFIKKENVSIFSPGMTAAAGPWGLSYAANITSDVTGIGAWTEAQFIKALREGKTKGLDDTRPILPPMPWPSYRNLSDDDLKAVFAYLQALPPQRNVVPPPM